MGERWGPRGGGGPCSQILDVFVPGKLVRSVNGLDVDVSKRQVWRMIPKVLSALRQAGGLQIVKLACFPASADGVT